MNKESLRRLPVCLVGFGLYLFPPLFPKLALLFDRVFPQYHFANKLIYILQIVSLEIWVAAALLYFSLVTFGLYFWVQYRDRKYYAKEKQEKHKNTSQWPTQWPTRNRASKLENKAIYGPQKRHFQNGTDTASRYKLVEKHRRDVNATIYQIQE